MNWLRTWWRCFRLGHDEYEAIDAGTPMIQLRCLRCGRKRVVNFFD